MKSSCRLQIPFEAHTLPHGLRKGVFQRGQFAMFGSENNEKICYLQNYPAVQVACVHFFLSDL